VRLRWGSVSLSKLLAFRAKLKEASNLLKDAETAIAAMLIIDDYRWLAEVEAIIERALENVREAKLLAWEMVEEAERARLSRSEGEEQPARAPSTREPQKPPTGATTHL